MRQSGTSSTASFNVRAPRGRLPFLLMSAWLMLGGLTVTPASANDDEACAETRVRSPLPAGLICAESYARRDAAISWYDTVGARDYNGLSNDDIDAFELPFPFIFYGSRYQSVNISSNGWISFTELLDSAPAHAAIPALTTPNAMIAGYWTDLNPASSTIYLETVGTEPDRAYVITFDDVPRNGAASDRYSFQIVLYETSNIIRIQWLSQIGNDFDMAIGIEDESGAAGDQFTRLTPIDLNGRAIEYVPTLPPLPSCASARPLSCGSDLTAQTMGSVNDADLYGCSLLSYAGFETQYTFTVDEVTLIDLALTDRGARNASLFLMPACDRCNCIAGETDRIRRVIGPGTYSVMVDTRTVNDSGTFDLSLGCETLLGSPTGSYMEVGDPGGGCSVALDFDAYANGHGVWLRDGWFYFDEDRSYVALRVDGSNGLRYSTNVTESACTPFRWMSTWVDDVTDKAVVYWEAPEGIVIHTVQGYQNAAGCCGVASTYRVLNTDTQGHWYELRDLHSTDLGQGQTSCAPNRMEGAFLEVGGNIYTTEQNLTCEASGLCAMDCSTPATLLSLETVSPALTVQTLGNSSANAVHGEWVIYWDVDRPCDGAAPALWQNGYLPIPDPTAICWESDALLYIWTMRPNEVDIPPGGSYSVTQTLGDGCSLAADCPCFAIADIQTSLFAACTNSPTVLDASGSLMPGCLENGGTITYDWQREGTSTGVTTARYSVNESLAGTYSYAVTVGCTAAGYTCAETDSVQIPVADCSQCSINSLLDAPWNEACQNVPFTIDASSSTVIGCPTTPSYAWTRNGTPLPDTGPTIVADVATLGASTYAVTITCALPGGGNCGNTSADLVVNVNDCSSCAVTPDLVSDTPSVCVGSSAVLDASASTTTGCPGAMSYTWRRDGAPLPDAGPTINATGTGAGSFTYDVVVDCEPAGGQCSGTSQPWLLDVFDCSSCAISAQLVGDTQSVCAGTQINLSAASSTVTGCPGATVHQWRRNGLPIPPTTATIPVVEANPGNVAYHVTVQCGPPPVGANCSDAAPIWPLEVSNCVGCALTADLADSPDTICANTASTLLTSASTITNCPGTLTYEWQREGLPVGGSTPTLIVSEPSAGSYNYSVTIGCDGPPTGLVCASSQANWLLTAQACACSITAGIAAPDAACVGDTVILDALAGSTVSACPGTLIFEWTEDGVIVPGATASTLDVTSPVAAAHDYTVRVTCDGPPGLNCEGLSGAFTVTWSVGTAPGDLGNTLLAYRQGLDVHLQWQQDPGGAAQTYDVLRGATKADLPLPGPPMVLTALPAPTAVDAGAIATPADGYYRVRGVSCPGLVGPY